MAIKLDPTIRGTLDEAFNRALRTGGAPSGLLPMGLSALLETGSDDNPIFGNVTASSLTVSGTLVGSEPMSNLVSPTAGAPIATYYVDPVAGSDSNPGTVGSPFLTIQKALDSIPLVVKDLYTINVAAGTCVETVQDIHMYSPGRFLRAQIQIIGAGAPITPVLGSGGSTTGTLGTDPVFPSITYTATIGSNWAVNELRGMFVLFTSGAFSGQCFPIAANTTNTIDIAPLSGAGASGASFQIIQLSNTISSNTSDSYCSIMAAGVGGPSQQKVGLLVQGFNFTSTIPVFVSGCASVMISTCTAINSPSIYLTNSSAQAHVDHCYLVGGASGAVYGLSNFDTLYMGGTVIHGGTFGILFGGRGTLVTDVAGGLVVQNQTNTGISMTDSVNFEFNPQSQGGNTYIRNGVVGLSLQMGWTGNMHQWAITGNSSHGIWIYGATAIGVGYNAVNMQGFAINNNGGDGIHIESPHNNIAFGGTNTITGNTGVGINIIQHSGTTMPASHNSVFVNSTTTMSGNGHDLSPDGTTFYTVAAVRALTGAFVTDTSGLFNRISTGAVTVGSWPGVFSSLTTTGGRIKNYQTYSGTSRVATASDDIIAMSGVSVRTVTLPGASPAGTEYTIVDSSGTATSTNTITVGASSGSVKSGGSATAVITPGTSGSLTAVSDGTNYWITAKI
jgi:hypothetical protein